MEKQKVKIVDRDRRFRMKTELAQIYSQYDMNLMMLQLGSKIPELMPNNLLNSMSESPHRILSHVYTATEDLIKIKEEHNEVSDDDFKVALASILYHDSLKLPHKDSIIERISEHSIYGHSIGIERILQYFELPKLAQAVRHNPLDFIADVIGKKVTIPQLLLNIVDRHNVSGVSTTFQSKEDELYRKFKDDPSFNFNADIKMTDILEEALHADNFSSLPYVSTDTTSPVDVGIIQRFDGKYVAPVGNHRDTCSNVHMGTNLMTFSFNPTIIYRSENSNESREDHQNGHMILKGVEEPKTSLLDEFIGISQHMDAMIVEGWTSVLPELKNRMSPDKPLILLMRAMSGAQLDESKLLNATYADEIWVMTQQMADIMNAQFLNINSNNKIPKIRLLTSGVDTEKFYVDPKIQRQRGKITYVGGITALKGVDKLVSAFDEVRRSNPEAELHLIGDPAIYGVKNEFDLDQIHKDGVIYHGALRAEAIAEHLKTAHISVLLTQIFEAFGKSAQQARACGTPMLVSNQGALPFHVQTPEEGVVLTDTSVPMITEALKQMLMINPHSVPPPENRYHTWKKTAIDFATNLSLCRRDMALRVD